MRGEPLIVGGGPAGSAAAIALANAGVRATVLERTKNPADAICGGFLSWRTLETLRALGVDPDALSGQPVARVRLFAGGRSVEQPLPRPALGLSRRRLDAALLDHAARAGAKVERGVAVRAIEHSTLRLADGTDLTPPAIFLATGKHDLRGLARPAAARGDDPVLGLRLRVGAGARVRHLVGDAIELHSFDRGYCGMVLHEDGSANLCMAVHRSRLHEAGDVPALLAALAREAPALGERLEGADPGTADAIANVPYGWRARAGKPGLFRLGDQAAVIPSIAGEGMGIALTSGRSAATAWLSGGESAATAWQRGFARRSRRPVALAGLVRAFAERRALSPLLLAAARLPGVVDLTARATRID